MSGYTCFCWSTHNQCPCKLEDLQKGLNQNETAHSSGATKPLYASSAVRNISNLYTVRAPLQPAVCIFLPHFSLRLVFESGLYCKEVSN